MPIETSMYSQTPTTKIDPAGAMASAISNAQGLQSLQTSKFDLLTKQMGTVRSALGSLAQDPTVTPEKVQAAGMQLVQQGLIQPQQLNTFMSGLNGLTGESLKGALSNHLAAMMTAHDAYMQANGSPVQNDTGQRVEMGTVSPRGGYQPMTSLQKQISPSEAVGDAQGMNEDGSPNVTARGVAAVRRGVPGGMLSPNGMPLVNNLTRPIAQPASPDSVNKLGVALPPPTPMPAAAPARAAPSPYGGLPAPESVGLPPGQADAAKVAGAASGQQLAEDSTHAAKISEKTFPLLQAIPALDRLGKTGTGPGTEQFNQIKSFLQSAGIPGIDASKIKDFDEAKKYLTDYVNRNGNSGTNDKLAAAFAGNPSVGISNAAAGDVAKSAVALDRMRAAQIQEFRKTGLPESKYSAWAANWNATQDPRAYGADLMGPIKTKQVVDSLSGEARSRFVKSLKSAHDSDLLKAGGQ